MAENNAVEIKLVYKDEASAKIQASTQKLKTSFESTATSAKKASEVEKRAFEDAANAAKAAEKAAKDAEKAQAAALKKSQEHAKNLKEIGLQAVGVGEKIGKLGAAFIAAAIAAKAIQVVVKYLSDAANAALAAAYAEEKVTGKINAGAASLRAKNQELEKAKLLIGQMIVDSGVLQSWKDLQISIANIATDALRALGYMTGMSEVGKIMKGEEVLLQIKNQIKVREDDVKLLEGAIKKLEGAGNFLSKMTVEDYASKIGVMKAEINGLLDMLAEGEKTQAERIKKFKPEGSNVPGTATETAQAEITKGLRDQLRTTQLKDDPVALLRYQKKEELKIVGLNEEQKSLISKRYNILIAEAKATERKREADLDKVQRQLTYEETVRDMAEATNAWKKDREERKKLEEQQEKEKAITQGLRTQLRTVELKDDPIALLKFQMEEEIRLLGTTEERKKLIQERYRLLSIAAEKDMVDKKKQLNASLGFVLANQASQTFAAIAQASKADGSVKKKIAQAGVVINTAEAVSKVMAQTGVISGLLIPLIIAQGAAQIAIIEQQKFAQGGYNTRRRVTVGERGPEDIDLPIGSRIYNAEETKELDGDKQRPVNNYYITATSTAIVDEFRKMIRTGDANGFLSDIKSSSYFRG